MSELEIKAGDKQLVVSGKFRCKYYEEIDLHSVHDFYIRVLRGRARIKARVRKHKEWKEYTVTPLSSDLVLKVEEVFTYCGWEECEETKTVMIYEYSSGWRKISEHVKEEW
jgi:hypothetical protein